MLALMETWKLTLSTVLSFQPEHVLFSCLETKNFPFIHTNSSSLSLSLPKHSVVTLFVTTLTDERHLSILLCRKNLLHSFIFNTLYTNTYKHIESLLMKSSFSSTQSILVNFPHTLQEYVSGIWNDFNLFERLNMQNINDTVEGTALLCKSLKQRKLLDKK